MARSQPLPDPSAPLERALSLIADLAAEDRAALRALPYRLAKVDKDEDIARQGEQPRHSCLVLRGFLCRYKSVEVGQRQILSFHLPGDMPDLQSLMLPKMDHALMALAPSEIAFVPHDALTDAIHRHPRLCDALWKATLIEASIFREWIAGMGRRSALQRLAHLLCEIHFRAGLFNEPGEPTPALTQAELGDALGVTAVHVNRLLHVLRESGLVAMRGRKLILLDWARLCALAAFDPAYMHLRRVPEPIRIP